MSEFEFLRNVTIGQYIPEDSIIHRLDPRTKLIGALLFALAVSSTRSVIATVLVLALLMGVIVLSKLPILYVLRGLLPGLPFLIFLFAMQILFQGGNIPCGVTWFEWWFVRITPCLAELVVLGMLRVVAFLYIVSLLTLTTTSSYLTHGIEILLAPLQRIGLPVHEFALANMIALRFIPTLAEELERTAKAQASRGGDFGNALVPARHHGARASAADHPALRQRAAPRRGSGAGHGGALVCRRQGAHEICRIALWRGRLGGYRVEPPCVAGRVAAALADAAYVVPIPVGAPAWTLCVKADWNEKGWTP